METLKKSIKVWNIHLPDHHGDTPLYRSRLTVEELARAGSIHADSACCGREEKLLEKKIDPYFIRRAYLNRPLTGEDKAHNKILSRTRARVEHVFGFQANSMRGGRLRTLDWERGCFQIGMGNLIYNLFRAAQLRARVG